MTMTAMMFDDSVHATLLLRSFVTLAVLGCLAHAQGPPNNNNNNCGDPSACVGLSSGDVCYVAASTQDLSCGVCTTGASGCPLQCAVNADQSSCNAAPTCTKYATTNEVAQVCGTTRVIVGDLLEEPPHVSSSSTSWQINMTVRLAQWNATAFTATTRLYCLSQGGSVQCSMPGPTIRFKPGDRVNLTLWNELPPETTSVKPMNTLRLPNTVNVHTHGLHVDPSVDNVAVTVSPGASRTYEYVIPSDHLPGNHWYHSHVHGASSTHVSGGMSGLLFVDDDAVISALSPTLAALPVHSIHIMKADFCSCNNGTGPFSLKSYPFLQSQASDNNPLAFHNFQQEPGFTETQVVLVNGQYQPRLMVLPGEWHRLDVVSAQGEMYLELEILAGVGTSAPAAAGCSMLLLSRDGVWLKNGPRNVSFVLLAPASRVSVAFQCNNSGTFYLQTVPRNRGALSTDPNFLQNLMSIVVTAEGTANVTAAPTWTAASFPSSSSVPYLTDTTSLLNANHSFELGLDLFGVTPPATHWLGVGQNCTITSTTTDPNSFGQCAYQPFDHMGSFRFAAPACGVVQMTINAIPGAAVPHPIHMHVVPMQIVSYTAEPSNIPDTLSNWVQVGDWLDTIPALAGRLVVRFHNVMIGQIMIHCHLLLHEDEGMMDRWWSGESNMSSCTATSVADNCNASVPARAFEVNYTSESVDCTAASATLTATPSPPSSGVPPGGSYTPSASSAAGPLYSSPTVIAAILLILLASLCTGRP